jgi:hypothetical protein
VLIVSTLVNWSAINTKAAMLSHTQYDVVLRMKVWRAMWLIAWIAET